MFCVNYLSFLEKYFYYFAIDYFSYYLHVPLEQLVYARYMGATWVSENRCWAVTRSIRIVTIEQKWISYSKVKWKLYSTKCSKPPQNVSKSKLTAKPFILTCNVSKLNRLKAVISLVAPSFGQRKGNWFHQDNERPHNLILLERFPCIYLIVNTSNRVFTTCSHLPRLI